MYTLLIVGLITLIIITILMNRDFGDLSFVIPLALLPTVFIAPFITLFISAIPSSDYKYVVKSEQTILALQDNTSVKGSFFLGSGNINGSMQYIYLIENEDGVQMKTVDVDNITIVEKDNTEPKIVTYRPVFNNEKWNNWAWNLNLNKTKIYIPKNSIKYNYTIDLK